MRRRLTPPRKKSLLRRLFLRVGLISIPFLAGYIAVVQIAVTPRLEDLAEYQCRALVIQAINTAVYKEMQQNPLRYEGLYTVEDTGNGFANVYADTSAINEARSCLINAAQEALIALPESKLRIPLGSLVGVTLLGGIGPAWELSLLPQAYVEGTVLEQTQPLAINRTQYTAVLELSTTINMVLDGKTSTARVTQQIPLASLLLDGETPDLYTEFGG